MLDNGQIVETGTYEKMMKNNGPFSILIRSYLELNQANTNITENKS